jgi:Rac GTPase-activating protein 1
MEDYYLIKLIKDFLRCQISEPILTYKLLPQVIEAAKHGYSEVLKKLVKKLPDANRDTLAFIIVHLQNVITNSKKNQMSQNSLGKKTLFCSFADLYL